jgi:hypothetical protein
MLKQAIEGFFKTLYLCNKGHKDFTLEEAYTQTAEADFACVNSYIR